MGKKHSNKIKIKKKTSLYSERKTIRRLLWIGVIGFVISIGLYLITLKKSCLGDFLNYWNNVALGLSASSFITYFSLKYIYQQKVNEMATVFQNGVHKIYKDYNVLISLFAVDSKKSFVPDKKSMDRYEDGALGLFSRENQKYHLAKEICTEIVTFIEGYNNSPVTIEAYENVSKYFSEYLFPAMQIVVDYCCGMVQYNENFLNLPLTIGLTDEQFKEAFIRVDDKNYEEISSKRKKTFNVLMITGQWNERVLERLENVVKHDELLNVCRECGIQALGYEESLQVRVDAEEALRYLIKDSLEVVRSIYGVRNKQFTVADCDKMFSTDIAYELSDSVDEKWQKVSTEALNRLCDENTGDGEDCIARKTEFLKDMNDFQDKIMQLLDHNRYLEAEEIVKAFEEKYKSVPNDTTTDVKQ